MPAGGGWLFQAAASREQAEPKAPHAAPASRPAGGLP